MYLILLLLRQHQAKLSLHSISCLNISFYEVKKFVPNKFNRKLRPISDLAYWKAAELRLLMLYVGFVLLKP